MDDLIGGKMLRIKHYEDGQGRLVVSCKKCKSYCRVGGKKPSTQGVKALLSYLLRHQHGDDLSPIETFRELFHYKPTLIEQAERVWLLVLAEGLRKAAGVKNE